MSAPLPRAADTEMSAMAKEFKNREADAKEVSHLVDHSLARFRLDVESTSFAETGERKAAL